MGKQSALLIMEVKSHTQMVEATAKSFSYRRVAIKHNVAMWISICFVYGLADV